MTTPPLQPPNEVQRVVAASRRTAYHPESRLARFLLWPFWPLLDPHTGRPSAPKCMAWAIYIAWIRGHQIAAMVCVLLLATMFGYSMFKAALDKSTLGLTSSDAVNVALKHEHTIAETITETRLPSKHDDERGDPQ